MSGTLNLAKDLHLPAANAASQVYSFMGRRGSGKTYGAGRLVEQLHEAGGQFCVVDPVGVWWGLRLGADGKRAGLDVPVFGGPHGDLMLPHTAGKVLAEMVATRSTSLVLDLSDMTVTEQRTFVADFAGELFQAKKRNKSALLVVFEECQEFVPQHVMGEQSKMVSHMQRLVKLGRNYGVGAALVSQRPQAVNKDVLNQTEMMLAFQLTGPQERKAIAAWVQEMGAGDREIADELPGLKTGHCIAWSPSWLGHFGRHKIAAKATFDASATPEGRDTLVTGQLPPLDLGELKAALEAARVEVTENDPKELKAEVARLRKELATASLAPRVVREEVAPAWLIPAIDKLREQTTDIELRATNLQKALQEMSVRVVGRWHANGKPTASELIGRTPLEPGRPYRERSRVPTRTTPAGPSFGGGPLEHSEIGGGGAAPARMLRALASRHPEPCSKRQVATLAGVPVRTSTFRNAVSKLSTTGLIEKLGDDMLKLTSEGLAAAGGEQPPKTPRELLAMWMQEVGGKARDMLEYYATEGRALKRHEVARHVGVDPGLSTFRNAMSQLRTNDLIRKTAGGEIINPELAQ